jgi:hypothetical protein
MHFKYGSLLSTVFSAAIMVGQAVAAPSEMQYIGQPAEAVSPVRQAFQNPHLQETMLERRRLLYEARTNTIILTNTAMSAHQEVPMGPK